ncbi:hypothetical protein BJ912DRAFT_1042063 [Pholiota molesta]|nr:hypothetical protein BJ912DRAFT_1042063 [Pholiota molesta]
MSDLPLTPSVTSRHPPTTGTLATIDSDPPTTRDWAAPGDEQVFLTSPTGNKTQHHCSSVFHISPPPSDFFTSPGPHTPARAVTTTPTRARTTGKKRDATTAGLKVRPLIRRVPPPEIAALILKSPRKGRIAAQFHALETHFNFFRQYHQDLVKENTTLSKDLDAALRELQKHTAIPQDTAQLQSELARANRELARARHYIRDLRELVVQARVKQESTESVI